MKKRKNYTWGIGGVADNLLTFGLATLIMPIFNIGFGVDAVLLGYALAVPRFIDMITDPVMGYISDRTKSRWGRRRPYIFVGAILSALLFTLIWLPPFQDKMWILGWFVTISVLLTLAYTVFSVPYLALGYEFTTDYDEKTRVMASRLYFCLIGVLFVQWLYKLCVLPVFGGDETVGIKFVGPLVGVIILITGLCPAVFCREKDKIERPRDDVHFMKAIGLAVKNRAFLIVLFVLLIIAIAQSAVGSLGYYVNIFYICGGDKGMAGTIGGITGSMMIGAAFVSMYLIGLLSRKTSKQTAGIIALALQFIGNLSLWFTWNPDYPYLQMVSLLLVGLGSQGVWLMIDSMVGDVCNDDEVRTGMQREGLYGASKGFTYKAAMTITAILSGYVLKWSGYIDGQVPTEQITVNLRLYFIGFQCSGILIAILALLLYPLSRAKVEENQQVIAERRRELV